MTLSGLEAPLNRILENRRGETDRFIRNRLPHVDEVASRKGIFAGPAARVIHESRLVWSAYESLAMRVVEDLAAFLQRVFGSDPPLESLDLARQCFGRHMLAEALEKRDWLDGRRPRTSPTVRTEAPDAQRAYLGARVLFERRLAVVEIGSALERPIPPSSTPEEHANASDGIEQVACHALASRGYRVVWLLKAWRSDA
jgi:hypothetical protein